MKGLKRVLGLAAFAIALTVSSSTTVSAQFIGEILKRMDDNNKGMKSLKSDIKMEKYNSQIGESDIYEGSVQYLPGPTIPANRLSRMTNTRSLSPTINRVSIVIASLSNLE